MTGMESVPETSYFSSILTRLVKPISVLPDDEDEVSPRNVVFFKYSDAAGKTDIGFT
jgi:hypothetical protein